MGFIGIKLAKALQLQRNLQIDYSILHTPVTETKEHISFLMTHDWLFRCVQMHTGKKVTQLSPRLIWYMCFPSTAFNQDSSGSHKFKIMRESRQCSAASKSPRFNITPQERVQFDSLRRCFIGNWATAGEKKCISSSHLRMSHDQSTLRIDMSLTNTGLLAGKKRKKEEEEQRRNKKEEEEERNGGMCVRDRE